MDRGARQATVHGVTKSRTQLNDFISLTSLASYFITGEGNGNSNILAWRIPWTEEPGGPLSMGLQRVGHK